MTEIDVSGCEGYKDKHCRYETSIMFTESNLCSNFPDCHYRQLKRLEAENAKLKELLETRCYNEVEFENKLLKADYEASEQENAELKETIQELNKAIQECNIQRTRLYKALEEIREIQTTCLEFRTCARCKFYEKCNKDIEDFILNKINEVLQ